MKATKQSRKTRSARYLSALLLLSWTAYGSVANAAPVKVACIGEHTTHSDLYSNTNREQQPAGKQEYPRMLQDLMGAGYDVRNFGDCCASVISGYASSETHPYLSGSNYKNSVSFAPDVVVIGSWGRHDWGLSAMTALKAFTIEKFQTDYETLVKAYLALSPVPKIYCSLPIPILAGKDGPDNGYKTSPAADAIKAVAAKYNLPTIDLYSAFLAHPELYRASPMSDAEGEHVNDAGMHKIADVVHAALIGGGGAAAGGAAGAGGQASGGGGGGSPSAGGDVGADGGAAQLAGSPGVAGGPGNASGGAPDTSGVSGSSAGVAASGGAASGGAPSAAGQPSAAPVSDPSSDSSGCSYSRADPHDETAAGFGAFLLAAGCVVSLRRRARPAPRC